MAFRGSTNLANWITNIDYAKTNYKNVPGAQVHEGFYSAYRAVSSQVISNVKGLVGKYSTASLIFTGHSLGGALATFAAVDVKEETGTANPIVMYTYGSPRTGN